MSKQVLFSEDIREKLKRGVNTVAKAVKVTMGARGRIVTIKDDFKRNHPTKDGYTVAKHIELDDPVEDLGASLVIEAAKKTVDEAGDGTTTTTVLTEAIFEGGLKNITAGANPIDIKNGITRAVEGLVKYLEVSSEDVGEDVEKIRQVATISANNDKEIGDLIANAIEKVGNQTVIKAEPSSNADTYVDVVEGLEFNQGYMSPYFITDLTKMSVEYDRPAILLLDGKINTIQTIIPLLEFTSSNNVPLVIIANEISGEVLQTLVLNKRQGKLQVSTIKTPYLNDKKKEFLQDIATLTGAVVISDDSGVGFESFDTDMLGGCKSISIKKDSTAIIGGSGTDEEIQERVDTLKARLGEVKDPRDEKFLKERIAKLSGGVAVMYVGANTESELKEKMDRVDDALSATRAAVEEGILVGGGTALVKGLSTIDFDSAPSQDERTGMAIVAEAIKQPFLQIVKNAGKETPEVVLSKVLEGDSTYGYDVKNQEYVDMKRAGIIDPKKVTRVSLESAASIAITLLMTEATITQKPE